MIKIYMKNITSKIENINPTIQQILLEKLNYKIKSFGEKPETKYLFNPNTNITYTGLIPHVLIILDILKEKYKLYDLREKPKQNANFEIDSNFSPRDYQKEIIDNVGSRAVIQAATGAGKTYIMAELIKKYNVKPVIVIAPKISLAVQIQNEFQRFFNTDIGIIGGGQNIVRDITVCTPMSIDDNLLDKCKMILYDEFHFSAAESIFQTGIKSKNAYYRFGMSATPWREDGKDLLLESLINKRKPSLSINASKLINKNKLTPCTINFIPIKNKFEWNGNYNELYKRAIINNENRNKIIADLAINKMLQGKTIIILIKNIDHGNKLLKLIKNDPRIEKYNTINKLTNEMDIIQFISGKDSLEERNDILQAVKDKKVKILIGSTIADEGLDLPILDCLILAGGGKSSTRAFQRIGRILRLYPGKEMAEVYDFKDFTPTMYQHYLYRKELYKTESRWIINELEEY